MIQKENEGSDRRPSCFSGWRKLPRPSAGWRSPGRQVRHRPHPAHAQQHTGTLCHRAQPPGTGRGRADSSSALHWRAWPEGPRPPPPPTPRGPGACNLEQRPSIHVSNRCRGRHSEGTPGESEVPLPTSTQQCNKGVRCSDNTDKRKCRPWAAGVLRKGDGPDAAWTVLTAKAQAHSGTIPPGGQGSLVLPGTDSAGCRARTGSVLGSP